MIFDGRDPPRPIGAYDLCIAGTGPAGQALFHELRQTGLRIAWVESGGREADPATDRLKETICSGLAIPPDARERWLGGTANTWQFGCVAHDEIDFQSRPWVDHSGWPFDRSELDPYYARAAAWLGIPTTLPAEGPIPFDDHELRTTLVVDTGRLRGFDPNVCRRLETAVRHDLFLHANVIDLCPDESGRRLASVKLCALGGSPFHLKAERFVLACGVIENARILLMADVGNGSDCVGRFFMEHPKGEYGEVIPAPDLTGLGPHQALHHNGTRYRCGLRLTPRIQEDYKVLNSAVRLIPKFRKTRSEAKRKVVSKILIKNFHEMAPCPSNRITLSDERDELGCPRAAVSCRLSELDRRTMVVLHDVLARRLEELGIGRLRSDLGGRMRDWPLTRDASHHMGATRMGRNREHSVVDAAGRCHEIENLFIAGSSVFPTSGHSNPTYTIIALAMRMADDLKGAG
ncbi:MAG: GMC oxidoreductase [Verrucomicrobiota bacterium]